MFHLSHCIIFLSLLTAARCLSAAPAAPTAPEPALRHIRDLRVWLDYDDDPATFAVWPVDKFGRKLPPDQIARGVRLGLALWASVLPDMRFRFAARPEEANVAFRFGDYRRSGFGDGGGRAFLPTEWSELDLECGRRLEGRRGGGPGAPTDGEGMPGEPCREWEHNIILLQKGRFAVQAVDYFGNAAFHAYFAWAFDPRRPHFRLPGGACRADTAGAAWDPWCVDYARSPHFRDIGGSDLVTVVQHEFGHALVGEHTPSPGEYAVFSRRPILDPDRALRRTPKGYSVMMPGDGAASWWNSRAVSRHDADRLRDLGYRVSYPETGAALVLARPGGAAREVSDWETAHRLLLWPLQGRPLTASQAARQLFLVDVRLDRREP